MKTNILIFEMLLLLFSVSCKNNTKTVEVGPNMEENILEDTSMTPEKLCYLYAFDKDSISLNIIKTKDQVKGDMKYNFYQIDESFGTFEGLMKGDTLRGIYDFEAEGIKSKRELIFLKRGDTFMLGKGETELSGDSESFKENTEFTFESGHVLKQVECKSAIL